MRLTRRMNDRLITLRELSDLLGGVPEKTLRNKLADGTWPVPPIRIGRSLRWRLSEVTKVISGETPVASSHRSKKA